MHKGDKNDPRVAVIEVVPDEIRYFVATKNIASRAIDIAVSAVTSRVASPGEVRTITKQEVSGSFHESSGGCCTILTAACRSSWWRV